MTDLMPKNKEVTKVHTPISQNSLTTDRKKYITLIIVFWCHLSVGGLSRGVGEHLSLKLMCWKLEKQANLLTLVVRWPGRSCSCVTVCVRSEARPLRSSPIEELHVLKVLKRSCWLWYKVARIHNIMLIVQAGMASKRHSFRQVVLMWWLIGGYSTSHLYLCSLGTASFPSFFEQKLVQSCPCFETTASNESGVKTPLDFLQTDFSRTWIAIIALRLIWFSPTALLCGFYIYAPMYTKQTSTQNFVVPIYTQLRLFKSVCMLYKWMLLTCISMFRSPAFVVRYYVLSIKNGSYSAE